MIVMKKIMKSTRFSLGVVADRFLLRPLFGIPFFFAVLALVFFLSFYGIGDMLSRFAERILLRYGELTATLLRGLGASDFTVRYLIGGVYTALASAIAFLPQTVFFFLIVRALDDCGYLARASLVTDRFFRIFGLSGHAVIPLLLGYGCAVSSVCACDPESAEGDAVLRALPFVPCNARLPVLLFLADALFPQYKVAVSVFVFALSFALIFLSLLMTARGKVEASEPAVRLPRYRLPAPRVLWQEIASTSRGYLIRAGTAVGLCNGVFSALAMLTPSLRPAKDISESILYGFSVGIAPVFHPLGFGGAVTSAALIFGFFAKENMIGVFRFLTEEDLSVFFSPSGAISFTVFSMFYTPCAPLLFSVAKKRGIRVSAKLFFRTFGMAYTVSLILYTLSRVIEVYC